MAVNVLRLSNIASACFKNEVTVCVCYKSGFHFPGEAAHCPFSFELSQDHLIRSFFCVVGFCHSTAIFSMTLLTCLYFLLVNFIETFTEHLRQ